MGVQLTPINLDKTSETEPAMSAFARGPEDGLIVVVGSLATIQRDLIIALAARPPSKTRTAPALESRPCNSNPSIDRHSPTPARPRWKWPMPGETCMANRDIRAALNEHWAASDANDFELEHQIYREDAVLEYPQ
jgi:hypothetical protein